MSGKGCRINIKAAMLALLLAKVHGKEIAPSGSFAAVAGAASPGTDGQRIASSSALPSATSTSAFAF